GQLILDDSREEAMDVRLEDVLDELRLDPDTYAAVHQRALVRCLAVREHARTDGPDAGDDLHDAADRFRSARALHDPAATQRWLGDNHLSLGQFAALMREELAVRRVEAGVGAVEVYLRSHLRVDGRSPALVERVRRKRRFLAGRGLDDVATAHHTPRAALLSWYFAAHGRDVPADLHG